MVYIDAFNRRDLNAHEASFHQGITHQSPYADSHLSQEDGHVDGKQAHREYLRWLWAQ